MPPNRSSFTRAVAAEFLPQIVDALDGVELVGDEASRQISPAIAAAEPTDFATEFLDMKMSVKIVSDLDEAIAHVAETSTGPQRSDNHQRCSRRGSFHS